MKKLTALSTQVVALTLLLSVNSNAAGIWQEDFSYSDGTLTTVSGGNWAAFSGAGNLAVQVVSGVAGLTNVASGTSGEDLRRALDASYTSGTLYMAALVSLNVAPSAANGDYFLSFYSSASSGGGFATRIFAGTTATGWTFGLSPSGTAPVDWGTDLSLNTTYEIVLKFDVGTKAVNMGVFDPSIGPDSDLTLTGTSTQTGAIDFVALRQGGSTSMSELIGGIWTGTTLGDVSGIGTPAVPEPSTLALASVGGLVALMAIRRRR